MAGFSFSQPSAGSPFSFSSQKMDPSSSKQTPFTFASATPSNDASLLFPQKNGAVATNGANADMDSGKDDIETLHLEPSAFSRKGKEKWKASGRGIMAAVCPVGGETASYISSSSSNDPNQAAGKVDNLSLPDRTVYFSSSSSFPEPLLSFYVETYTLFTSLQRIAAVDLRLPSEGIRNVTAEAWDRHGNLVGAGSLLGPPGAETVGHMRRLVTMYLEELMRVREAEDLDPEIKARYDAVYHIFHLAEILYLPQDGRGEGLLGEELLDWLNDVDPAPDNTLGNEIMQTRDPWTHPAFWPYVNRCLLRGFHLPASSFLRTLTAHPHSPIAKLGSLLSSHLSLLPRSHNTTAYPLDHQFLTAHKQWESRFRAELAAFLGARGNGRWLDDGKGGKDWREFEESFKLVVELMEGNVERVLEEAGDWREAVGAWGVLVEPGMRRDDLPRVMKSIIKTVPVDRTVLDDSIQAHLCMGKIIQALTDCHELDAWLAAHLGDVFDKLMMIPDDEERFETSLRDYFLLEYTDFLATSTRASSLWRIIADYLSAAGDEGRGRLNTFILHIGLESNDLKRADKQPQANGDVSDMEVEASGIEAEYRHFADLREACVELRLEDEWKTISRLMGDRLLRQEKFGLAATMCLQAEDGYTLSRIAERILETFVLHGGEAYLTVVDTLPVTLLNEAPQAFQDLQKDPESALPLDLPNQTAVSIFASRLAFLAEFRDYLLFLGQGARDLAASRLVGLMTTGIAPASFWAVLLAESVPLLEDADVLFSADDTFELLRVLEDVTTHASFAPSDYLSQVSMVVHRQAGQTQSSKDLSAAWKKLEEVRLALARNLSRALVTGFDNPF
ncbi:Nup85 nucleoporin-domain-containing protein [Naematelia encephala]|uniref:Nuclear pore complex protein Nup85 n=1 Tax=Naematelia encephala TaxID=71784 RepID=A0A1Y2B2E5_9TREE|nr:Nup85 nucleoporin-domain-containing protein [Naematelia encephala]